MGLCRGLTAHHTSLQTSAPHFGIGVGATFSEGRCTAVEIPQNRLRLGCLYPRQQIAAAFFRQKAPAKW